MKYRLLPSASLCTVALVFSSVAFSQTAPAAANDNSQEIAEAQQRAAAATPAATPALPATTILPSVDRSTSGATTLTGSLEAGRVAGAIQVQEFDKKDDLIREVTERVQAVDRHIAELRQRAGNMEEPARRALETATTEYEQAKNRLQESIETARNAEERATWERARLSVATNYAFFVSSVGSMEVALP